MFGNPLQNYVWVKSNFARGSDFLLLHSLCFFFFYQLNLHWNVCHNISNCKPNMHLVVIFNWLFWIVNRHGFMHFPIIFIVIINNNNAKVITPDTTYTIKSNSTTTTKSINTWTINSNSTTNIFIFRNRPFRVSETQQFFIVTIILVHQ